MAEPGGRMGLGPPLLCLDIVSLSNTISIGSSDKVTCSMKKNVAEFWQYFVDIISHIWFVIWQDFVIVWQNTPCRVYHLAMDCLSHLCCGTVLPDGVIQHNFSQKMVSFYMLVCMDVGRNFSRGGGTSEFVPKLFYGGPKMVKFVFYHSKLRKQHFC